MTKIIIAGGRDFKDFSLLCRKMDHLTSNLTGVEVVCGGARGADSLGEQWAKYRGHKIKYFMADWDSLGRGAGHVRNRQMGDYADCLVAFYDGSSKGTKGMIEYANKIKLKVRIISYELR